jgi:hypothetical protein
VARSGLPVPVPRPPRANEMVVVHIRTGGSASNGLRGFFWKPVLPSISLGGGPFTPLLAATAHDGIVVHVPAVAGFDPQFGGAIDWTTIAVRGGHGPIRLDFDAVPMHGTPPYPVGEVSETPLPNYRLLGGPGGDRVVSPRGAVLRVVPGGGVLDYAFVQRTSLVLRGWSGDAAAGVPASTILIFADGKLVFAGKPNRHRPDVAAGLGHPELVTSGYRVLVPLRDVLPGRHRRHVRIFSVANGKALEVSYSQSYAWR